ncbi:MAG: hypothetical protein KDE51_06930, partial [Anaerolineales bacterium]|nr:hypothetical protein [Anaerolineales bacterium]
MLNKTFLKFVFSTLLLFLASLSMVSTAQPEIEQPDSLTITLTTPSYTITNDGTFDFIDLPEFGYDGETGNPQLPGKIYNIVLPPQVDPFRVELTIVSAVTTELPGEYEIAAVPPAVTWADGQQIIDWGPYAASISDGRNQDVYGANQYFPTSSANFLQQEQMRKWRFVQLHYMPFQYNPVTKKLRLTTELEVTVSYTLRSTLHAAEVMSLTDTLMDEQAAEMFYNFDEARHWYETAPVSPETQANPTYVIITTNRIATHSTMLDDFISHTAAKGYDVELITQNEYGSLTGQAPNGTAEKVRQWLIQNYIPKQIEYVLLIGDPNPDDPSNLTDAVGDLPMKMMWPRYSQTTYRETPTDYFFADLTGNWDLDGDGYFGEYGQDSGIGGVDFTAEVYVGRIPVYAELFDQDIPKLDAILQKIITYDNELYPSWRHSALLPMSFADASTDGAYLAEAMKVNYLNPLGYSNYTLYQQSPACTDSIFTSDEPLIHNAVVNHWSGNPYGTMLWSGHGSATSTSIGYGGCDGGGTLFNTSQATSLNNSRPAITYLNSCTNGYPESSSNLGYNLLRFGAIGTVSASRVSWYSMGQWQPYKTDNAGLGYRYMAYIADGDSTGLALYTVKANFGYSGNTKWMNLMDFNLYGDPLTRISQGGIHGYVRDTAGVGIAGAMVQVEGYPAVYTDNNGYFEQSPILYGNRAVRISKAGYAFMPNYSQRNFWNYPLDHNAIGYPFTPAAVPFFDGFEEATLSPAWALERDLDGRVQLSTAYPYAGSQSLLLDNAVDNGYYSSAAAILAIDLADTDQAELSFWWRSFDDEPHPEDGVTMSFNNGQTWIPLYHFDSTISAGNFVETVIDLDEAAVNAGQTLNDHMLIKFRFYDNFPIPSDGYAI